MAGTPQVSRPFFDLNMYMKISELKPSLLTEAITQVPLTDGDFDQIKQLMCKPVPAIMATIYLQGLIEDSQFSDLMDEVAANDPAADVRQHIADWIKRVMPDQLYRFRGDAQTTRQREGIGSPISGDDQFKL